MSGEGARASRTVAAPSPRSGIVVALLGPVATMRDGDVVPLTGIRARRLLVALAHPSGRSRTARSLIEDVWGDEPPRSPTGALHTQISRLRSALPEGVLESGPAGYRLTLPSDSVDLSLAQEVARAVTSGMPPARVVEKVTEAKNLWRGEPGDDLGEGHLSWALAMEAGAIREQLDDAEITARIALGDFEVALPLARARTSAEPLDERAHEQLMRILAGLGRENEAVDVFAGVRERLADRLGADPSRELVDLHTRILQSGAAPQPAVPSAVGLRASPNTLIGREDDITAIEGLLERGRVVTVLGPGGAGKTRLAHELGSRASARKPVALVELASLRSSEDVVAAIAATVGVGEVDAAPGRFTIGRIHSVRERLRESLSARPMLLILDNCEHVIGACSEVVADLVAEIDTLTVLTTSRSPLMIAAESVYPLPPLTVGDSESPAVELFTARARAVRPSVRLDSVAVRTVCRTLDGLPLAIELAAARVRSMSVEEIGRRLVDRFALLRSSDPTSPDRHRTLHSVIDWSWHLLESEQQIALRRLCRFPDGFTLDAAESVAAWDGLVDVAGAVDGLVNQSLLTVTETSTSVRYFMLETVREYGEEQLIAAGEDEQVLDRLSLWAQEIARDATRRCRTDQVQLSADLSADHDNLLAVLRWSMQRQDAVTTAAVFAVLGGLWVTRGAHSEVANWAPRVLNVTAHRDLSELPSEVEVTAFLLVTMHLLIGGERRTLARARLRLRAVRRRTGVPPVLTFGADILLAIGSPSGMARRIATGVRSSDTEVRMAALSGRANFRENLGDARGALADGSAVHEYAKRRGDVWFRGTSAGFLGSLHSQAGRYAEAVHYYEEAVTCMTSLGAVYESEQMRAFEACARIASGDVEGGRRGLFASAARFDSEYVLNPDTTGPKAAQIVGLAEADLASGDVERGLGRYEEAVALVRSDSHVFEDPFSLLLLSASLCAHVQCGRVEAVDVAELLRTAALARLGSGVFVDIPVTGAVAGSFGVFAVANGDVARGLQLIALAERAHGRQDMRSMQHERLRAFASTVASQDDVDAAATAVSTLSRRQVRAAILELIAART